MWSMCFLRMATHLFGIFSSSMTGLLFVASLNEGGTLSFQVMNDKNQQSMKPLAIALFMRNLSKIEQKH